MNYRHHFHAGNFADVMKHVLLIQLARALQKKPGGVLFLDTHAGRGGYDLSVAATGDTLARKPEHPDGIGRLFSQDNLPAAVAEYVGLVRAYDQEKQGSSSRPFRFYPGSPQLLKRIARGQDRIDLWEKHPEECEELRSEVGWARRVAVEEGNGYGALRARLPPPERRALVLIDPPYEDADEGQKIVQALSEGLARFPSGIYAIWFPLTRRSVAPAMAMAIQALRPPPTLAVELTVNPDSAGLSGCGLLIVNPPWMFDSQVRPLLQFLSERLAQAPGAAGTLRWLVSE